MDTLIEGKYEVIAKLKEGGMGSVFKVRHVLLDDVRVIKVMRPQIEGDADAQRRFQQEARLATSLKHPNIADLMDFSVDANGNFYMVMEYIEGVTLAELVAARGPLALKTALEVADQTLRALSYLHKRGIVHRDIAPDNLMVSKGPDDRIVVKLIDLGIAKDTSVEGMTQAGIFLGKLKYASPEQLGALPPGQKLDTRSDLYSFGCVLYQLLTGHSPYKAEAPQQYLILHLTEAPRPFEKTDPEGRVPEDVRRAVMRALAKKREDRWQTADEFAMELRRCRAELSGLGRASSATRLAPVVPDARPAKEAKQRPEPEPAEEVGGKTEIIVPHATLTRAKSAVRIPAVTPQAPPPPPPPPPRPVQKLRERLQTTAWERMKTDRGPAPAADWRKSAAVLGGIAVVAGLLTAAVVGLRSCSGGNARPTAIATAVVATPTAVVAVQPTAMPEPTPAPTATIVAAPTPEPPPKATVGPQVNVPEVATPRPKPTKSAVPTPAPTTPPPTRAAPTAVPTAAGPSPDQEAQRFMAAGWASLSQGDPASALKSFDRALDLNPRNLNARLGRARARLLLKDFDGAIGDATAVLNADPKEASALLTRGLARQSKRDLPGAMADFSAAIEQKPNDPAGYRYRATVRKQLRDRAGAAADERKAAELSR